MGKIAVGAVLVASVIALSASACSSSSTSAPAYTSLDAQAFCTMNVTTCNNGGTLDSCLETARALRVSQACADAMKTATCKDLSDSTAPLNDTCFPKCDTPNTATCESDNNALDKCDSDGRFQVFDCAKSCSATGGRTGLPFFTGTCGTSYQGQTSADAVCWCSK
jgi:hypothetical protein